MYSKALPDLHKKTERMVQAGIWMVYFIDDGLLILASWLQGKIRRFDNYVVQFVDCIWINL